MLLFPYVRKESAVIITVIVHAENDDADDVIMSCFLLPLSAKDVKVDQ